MQHEEASIVREPGTHRQHARLDSIFVRVHERGRYVGVVLTPHIGSGSEAADGIKGLGDLEVIDVNVDRMLIVVLIDERPFFNRTKPRLD